MVQSNFRHFNFAFTCKFFLVNVEFGNYKSFPIPVVIRGVSFFFIWWILASSDNNSSYDIKAALKAYRTSRGGPVQHGVGGVL